MDIADKIRLIMKERGLKQREICRLTGVKPSTLSEILSGKRRMGSADTLEKLSNGLGVDFIGETEGPYDGAINKCIKLGITPELLGELLNVIEKIKNPGR